MDKVFVKDLVEGETVTSFFLAKQVQVRQRRNGEPFLTLVLADRSGEVPAVLWEGAEAVG
jgi:3'-5' exoribonuclease